MKTLLKFYKTYARLYLEYASIVSSPHRLQLIDAIERVLSNFIIRLKGFLDVFLQTKTAICKIGIT